MRVLLERGSRWTFAVALDWPGWARRARGDEAALAVLADYVGRYRDVVGDAVPPGPFSVVVTVPGTATTDFGAPDARGEWDDEPLAPEERARQARLLEACWRAFDLAAASAPEHLTKGPRGGGRDTSRVVDHVREAERAYARTVGVRVPPGTPWPEQRDALLQRLLAGGTGSWPDRYAARRVAWHVLDHLWEIEDRTPTAGSGTSTVAGR